MTSLLFDLNYKFELIGASLLALAKSKYYLGNFHVKGDLQTKTQRKLTTTSAQLYPPFCFSQNSNAVAS